MTRQSLRLLLALGLLTPSAASAARETDVAGFLHGEIGLEFQNRGRFGTLSEHDVAIGRLSDSSAGLNIDLRVGVLPGLEVFGGLRLVVNGSRRYVDPAGMCGDEANIPTGSVVYEENPTSCTRYSTVFLNPDTGYYQANPGAVSVPEYLYRGTSNGVLGIHFSPFHEADLGTLGTKGSSFASTFRPQVSWRLELGLVLNTGRDFYEGGGGTGTGGLVIGTSFSRRVGSAEPYLVARHTRYGSYQAALTAADGQTYTGELSPPDETLLQFGVELTPYSERRTGARFGVDFAAGAHLWSESTVFSGTLLPSVVTSTVEPNDPVYGDVVTEEEQFGLEGKLFLHYQVFRHLRLDGGGTLAYVIPHRLESPYDIVLSRNIVTSLEVSLTTSF